jgi:hypothetical protein
VLVVVVAVLVVLVVVLVVPEVVLVVDLPFFSFYSLFSFVFGFSFLFCSFFSFVVACLFYRITAVDFLLSSSSCVDSRWAILCPLFTPLPFTLFFFLVRRSTAALFFLSARPQ